MIPISDDNPVRITPFVNWLLIALCVAAFAWQLSLGSQEEAVTNALGFIPATLLDPSLAPSLALGVPAQLTILTSMFLHGGLLHLGGNMLYLWIFGNNVEDAMGHVRYLLFYLASGIAAALTMAFVNAGSQVPMIGASGAISGVLGAYVLLYPRAKIRVLVPLGIIIFYPFRISAIFVVGFWFLLQLFNAAFTDASQPGVAWWAHVGGFVAGLLLTPLLKSSEFTLFGEPRRGPWG
ncbi:MAG TPA: rhomboid family intramembrane serine protease [Rhizomicrobium sp.]|nr:rhomboid family intramembrane serine protease [Rhizomicrobium sp.]